MEDWVSAWHDVNRVVNLNHRFSNGYHLKGKILLQLGRFQDAETQFLISYSLDGNKGKLNEEWLHRNIFQYLVSAGADAVMASAVADKHLTIQNARNFIESGGYAEMICNMVYRKHIKFQASYKRLGKVYPISWFCTVAPLKAVKQ